MPKIEYNRSRSMQKNNLFLGIVLILLSILLFNPGSVHAQNTLVIPVTGPIPGLTFLTPRPTQPPIPALTFSSISIPSQTNYSQNEAELVAAPDIKLEIAQPKPINIVVGPNLALNLTASSAVPSPTLSPTPVDTPTPVPVNTPKPTITPPTNPPQVTGGLNADVLFSMVNSHRVSINLPAFQKEDRICSLAESRAPQVGAEIAGGHMHSGLKALNLPYWETENIISYNSNQGAFNWWMNDKIHRDAIEGNYKYSCVACSGKACAEEFTNFQPK
jgi:uncharacterized protein YkwD